MAQWRVIISATVYGQLCQNVLNFLTDVGFGTDEEDVKDNVLAQWVSEVRNVQNANTIYTTIGVQRIDVLQPLQVFSISGTVGSLAGAAAPTFTCGVFSIRTASAGRAGHGRFYMFGVHMESILTGALHPAAYAQYQTVAANLTTRFCTGGTQPLLLGVTSRTNPVADFKGSTVILARQIFGVQRRRNIGVGG